MRAAAAHRDICDRKLVRRAMPGTAARTLSRVLRKMSAPAPRFMVFNTSGDACCSGTSRYLRSEAGAEGDAGDCRADLVEGLEEDVCARAALHGLQHLGGCVLQRHIEIFAIGSWCGGRCRGLPRGPCRGS